MLRNIFYVNNYYYLSYSPRTTTIRRENASKNKNKRELNEELYYIIDKYYHYRYFNSNY